MTLKTKLINYRAIMSEITLEIKFFQLLIIGISSRKKLLFGKMEEYLELITVTTEMFR